MIRLENVSKTYEGGIEAVKSVSMEITKGEFVFLVGPSGSGKSTLIRLMLREERPSSGDLWVAGKHASALPNWKVPQLRRNIGTVFQDFKLLPNKTVFENVAFALEVTGRSRGEIRGQVPQVLKLVGLSQKADRYPRTLSGGEQQRVTIARAFVNRPLILLADEPTGNLDPATSVGIMRILDRINRTGTTVVMATHDHAIVDAMRRRVVQLEKGEMVRDQSRGVYERVATAGNPQDEAEAAAGEPTAEESDEVGAPGEADIASEDTEETASDPGDGAAEDDGEEAGEGDSREGVEPELVEAAADRDGGDGDER